MADSNALFNAVLVEMRQNALDAVQWVHDNERRRVLMASGVLRAWASGDRGAKASNRFRILID